MLIWKGCLDQNLESCCRFRPVDARVPKNGQCQENRLQVLYLHGFFARTPHQSSEVPTKGPSHPSLGKTAPFLWHFGPGTKNLLGGKQKPHSQPWSLWIKVSQVWVNDSPVGQMTSNSLLTTKLPELIKLSSGRWLKSSYVRSLCLRRKVWVTAR